MKCLEFFDAEKTTQLREEGYVIVDLLNEATVSELTEMFHAFHREQPEGFYATTHLSDKETAKAISDQLHKTLHHQIEAQFENLNLLGGAFISKAPGEKGILPLHQDWNLVDETQARSYNIWIPLVEVNEANGAMRILPKSHTKQQTFRGPNVAPVLYQISKEVDKTMISLNMKKGQALIYDHALWHSSPQNKTNQLRLALVLGAIPTEVDMKYYHQKGNLVEEYASNPEFFFSNEQDSGPVGLSLLRSFEHPNEQLSLEQFNRVYLEKEEHQMPKKNFFQKIFSR